jgi:AraC-like DNA-binding protein
MTQRIEGQDFASAAMMRLVAAGLSRQGISIPVPTSSNAHVPLLDKQDVLGAVLAMHGPTAILSIGDAARCMPPEPVAQALSLSRDIPDLLNRWHRLERFSHGCHTVEAEQLGSTSFRLTHRSHHGAPSPSVAESLLVLGLLTILAEMIGATDVSLANADGVPWRSDGEWRTLGVPQTVGSVVLTASVQRKTLNLPAAAQLVDPVARLRSRLVSDPVRRWTVANLAAEAGASPRTLQRRLTESSLSFSRLVADARIEVAATHLCKANGPALAEIAFIAGFADQAHFARTFIRAVGTTPRQYRTSFGR